MTNDYPHDRDREGGRQNRLQTPTLRDREVEHTRRVKPRYDFLTKDSESFGDLRQTSPVRQQPIRRMRGVLDKKGVTETIHDMFNDDFEELISFFTEKVNENKKKEVEERDEERLQKYINRIRRMSCSIVNKKRSSPIMMGRILPNQKVYPGFRSRTQTSVHPRKTGIDKKCLTVPQSE